jgi:hypothetical protein
MVRHLQLEGLFTYIAPEASGASAQSTARVFLSISKCLESSDEPSTPRSPLIRKRPSQFSLRSNTPINRPRTPSDPPPCTPGRRVYDFSITLPDSSKSGEELPHSFSHSQQMLAGGRGRTGTERAEVSYRLIVNWEAAYDPARPTRHSPRLAPHPPAFAAFAYVYCFSLEAPILIQLDSEWSSLDGCSPTSNPSSWIEVPLRADRPLPFSCAVTLPRPATFPRASTASRRDGSESPGAAAAAGGGIPYFVVFSAAERTPALVHEVAADATISTSLVRVIHINGVPVELDQEPLTPTSAPPVTRRRMGRRIGGSICDWFPRPNPKEGLGRSLSAPVSPVDGPPHLRQRDHAPSAWSGKDRSPVRETAMPDSPVSPSTPSIVDTRRLQTSMCVGFPRRPRHPPEADAASGELPDGLHQGRLRLSKDMVPGVKWAGLRVKVGYCSCTRV